MRSPSENDEQNDTWIGVHKLTWIGVGLVVVSFVSLTIDSMGACDDATALGWGCS